ncbi:right-handed parallel beta-helix repeat-containing protein [Thermodesulfobacteriota bacterium]
MIILSKRKKRRRVFLVVIIVVLISLLATYYFIDKPALRHLRNNRTAESFIAKQYPTFESRCRYMKYECKQNLTDAIQETLLSKLEYIAGRTSIPKININIKFTALQKINKKRDEALKKGLLFSSKDDYVNASLNYQGRKIKVKLRLKGDHVDHLVHPKKWSFRVKTKKDDHFMGMRAFSLQNPSTKAYQYEALFHQMLRDNDIAALRYFFVKASINGEDIGLMAVEEHFSKELLESQRRREGVILKFDESASWQWWPEVGQKIKKINDEMVFPEDINEPSATYYNIINYDICAAYWNVFGTFIDTFRSSKIEKSKTLSDQKRLGIGILRGVANRSIPPSDAFDVELMGKFFAVPFSLNSFHSLHWMNLRFYLNPITLKLEPVPFDGDLTHITPIRELSSKILSGHGHETIADTFGLAFTKILLSDPKIMQATLDSLKEMNRKIKEEDLIKKYIDGSKKHLRILHTEFRLLPPIALFTLEFIDKKLDHNIDSSINELQRVNLSIKEHEVDPLSVQVSKEIRFPRVVQANIIKNGSETLLELSNILPVDTTIDKLNITHKGIKVETKNIISVELPITLQKTDLNAVPKVHTIKLNNVLEDDELLITGDASPVSQELSYSFTATPYASLLTQHPLKPHALLTILKNDFLSLSKDGKTINVKKGDFNVTDFIILPEGIGFKINEGTTLRFSKEAGIIVNGRVTMLGSKEEPIILTSIDENTMWSGFTVMNANKHTEEDSILKSVIIKNTDYAKHNGWIASGGTLFYKSNLKLQDVTIDNSIAEDGINIFDSDFVMQSVHIKKSRSDGFDSDFSRGEIIDSTFENINGDAVDFSGSSVRIINCTFNNIKDKAVSAGEASDLFVNNIHVSNTSTGLVSKDNSIVILENSEFKNIAHYSLMAYIKKPEYGPGKIVGKNISLDKASVIVQKGSRIFINEKKVRPRDVDIDELYKSGHMKK